MVTRSICFGILAATISLNAYATVVYVRADGGGGNFGTSWEDAVNTIGTGLAIAASAEASEVWVAAGEYTETVQLRGGIALLGGFDGTETSADERAPWANETVISGNTALQAVLGADGGVIDGFTIFRGKTGDTSGGGGLANVSGAVTVLNCQFVENVAGFGGAIWNFQGDVTVVNCLFTENRAEFGAVVYNLLGNVDMVNCTVAGNRSDSGGKMFYTVTGTTTVSSSIVWGNNGGSLLDVSNGETTLADSIVKDGTGTNVVSTDPLFFSQEHGDYRLRGSSLAVNSGVAFNLTPAIDIRGFDRIGDDAIDMGAIEFHLSDPTDTDGDGIGDALEDTDDPDGDDIPNYLDDDSNGNGVLDILEGGGDFDGDGIPNFLDDDADGNGLDADAEGTGDTDDDNMPNVIDPDNDGDGIPDVAEGILDLDGDDIPNLNDTDADGDGILDSDEGASDVDGDGLPNFLDLDSDGNGISDEEEGNVDDDGDGVANFLDDDNAVPMIMTDVNVDGTVNASDIQSVINAVLGI